MVTQFPADANLSDLHIVFKSLGVRCIFLTNHGRLSGILTKKDFLKVCRLACLKSPACYP